MSWNFKKNGMQLETASWDKLLHKAQMSSEEEARRAGFFLPKCTYFIYCETETTLTGEGALYSPLQPGDTLFFYGEPTWGTSSGTNGYIKTPGLVLYYAPSKAGDNYQDLFGQIACYRTASGAPAVDCVILRLAQFTNDSSMPIGLGTQYPAGSGHNDPNLQALLGTDAIQRMQGMGITVLLGIDNGHSNNGWSEFEDSTTGQGDAQDMLNYLKTNIMDVYHFDGVDIDDEYYDGDGNKRNPNSLPMVAAKFRETMKDRILTKALWRDQEYFDKKYAFNGRKLADSLTYGWSMVYSSEPTALGVNAELEQYISYGMEKNRLFYGMSTETADLPSSTNATTGAKGAVSDGYGGCMIFNYQRLPEGNTLAEAISDGMHGSGNWVMDPHCDETGWEAKWNEPAG